MNKTTIKQNLWFLKDKVDKKTFIKIINACQESIIDYINTEGIELWNSDCTMRMLGGDLTVSDKRLRICRYDDPLHEIKRYNDLDKALKFINSETNDNNTN